ncbi:MAG: transglycosylase SLT domain-containing protein [Bdellovibrio sp.]|nr:transglycosylase SLT domain-containing protein [Bdellovibrio sp.]
MDFGVVNFAMRFQFKLTILGVAVFLATGCAHVKPRDASSANGPAPKNLSDILKDSKSQDMITVQNGEVIVQGIRLKNSKFDIPITINSRVEHWIDYFCGRGRGYFTKYLERSEFFIPYIEPLLRQNGMPQDLVYLAMIESGFNNLARSRARAVGPWQFISATGKRYGLMVNWWVDERRDIEKSTLSAVQYLKDLYSMFQSWELAAAAYNAGEAKIARAVRRFGSKDFWTISKHRFLRPETRDYVPKIIAAAIISKNRGQFGFPESAIKPGVDEAVAGDGELVKVVKTDKPMADSQYDVEKDEDLQELVDSKDDAEPTPTPMGISGVSPAVNSNSESNPPKVLTEAAPIAKPVPTPHVTKTGEVGGESLVDFDVQSPADLLKIARAAGLSYQTVKALNPEVLRWCTPPTVGSYRIRLPSSVRDHFLATYNHEAFPRKVQFMTYKVRSGETLSRIAKHFGIKVDPITDLNGVSPRTPLRHGAKVLLPMPSDRSRTFASLEVRDPPERRRARRHHRRRNSRSANFHRNQAGIKADRADS